MGRIAAGTVVAVYTTGVVVSGVYLERTWGEAGQTAILAASVALAVAWTVYYQFVLQSRVERLSKPGASWRLSDDDDDAIEADDVSSGSNDDRSDD